MFKSKKVYNRVMAVLKQKIQSAQEQFERDEEALDEKFQLDQEALVNSLELDKGELLENHVSNIISKIL